MSPPVLKLSGVSVGPVQTPILQDIELELEAGHFLGIVGPNGAGKSTLLSVIAGLIEPAKGSIELFGQPLRRLNRRQLLQQIGFLSQLHDDLPKLPVSVRHVVTMGAAGYASPLWRRPAAQEDIVWAMEQVDIAGLADRDFRQLSGGQRQRVRLAKSLVSRPRLLLLDEPSAALDAPAQDRLYRLLRHLCDENGMAIIMVEHDIAAITGHVDSVACLNRRIHCHAMKGEQIPEDIWHAMYGEHMHVIAHDTRCIGCVSEPPASSTAHRH
ncbi:MAG TPA: ABC transporter ATP-binding protein [Mariprofundaceae bacterium]|nr:ABC transporter ATP-binding protein [Mariprofundaceae bacterium]